MDQHELDVQDRCDEVVAMRDERDRLRAELAELRKDRERLRFLFQERDPLPIGSYTNPDALICLVVKDEANISNFQQFIVSLDAAMSAPAGGKNEGNS